MEELKRRLEMDGEAVDIMGITEIYPKNLRYKPTNAELQIKEYDMFLNESREVNQRGVALYISECLGAVEYKIESQFKESIWAKIQLNSAECLLVGCIYKSPSSSKENVEDLRNIMRKVGNLTHEFTHLLIMGDFNFPSINWETWTSQNSSEGEAFIECVRDGYFYQHVLKPTRARSDNIPSTLDLIFTNEELVTDIQYLSPLGASDHCVLRFKFHSYMEGNLCREGKWNYSKADYEGMRNTLNRKWDSELQNLDSTEAIGRFTKIYNEAQEKHVPKMCPKISKSGKNQKRQKLDADIVKKIKKKHRCWQRFMETRDEAKRTEYAKIRNQVKGMVRKSKREKEKEIAKKAKTDPKLFWRYVNSKRLAKTGIAELKTSEDGENRLAKTDKEKAEVLAKFFTSVFTNEPDGDIPKLEDKQVQEKGNDEPWTVEEVQKLLKSIVKNKAPGPDNVHPNVILELKDILAKPLTIMFNKSLAEGKVPEIWKMANVTALFKKGDKSDPGNYRPVSLTSVVCKLMEKLVRMRILDHMSRNDLISRQQFGFLSGRSTGLQLLKVMDEWTNILDRGGSIDTIYMDFMKAFDTVPHRRLLGKLKSYGISEKIIAWIRNFLMGRTQKVVVNGVKSSDRNVTSGIPQGSVLGPILFVIYINDLPEVVNSTAYLFADDTKLYREIKDKNDETELQEDLNRLQNWSDTWLLRFHPNKCKLMTVSNGKQGEDKEKEYHLYNQTNEKVILEEVSKEKDIGVVVDECLTFRAHIQAQVNKANGIMGLIRRTFTYLDEDMFVYLFKALVRPHLEYAGSVWSPQLKKDIIAVENVQRRATRQVPSLKEMDYPSRLRKLGLPTLKYRRLRGDAIEVFKILKGIYDPDVTAGMMELATFKPTRGHNLKLEKKRCRLEIRKRSFTNRVVDMWNGLPSEIMNAESVFEFEVGLDAFWQDQEMKYDFTEDYKALGNHTKERFRLKRQSLSTYEHTHSK